MYEIVGVAKKARFLREEGQGYQRNLDFIRVQIHSCFAPYWLQTHLVRAAAVDGGKQYFTYHS